MQKTDDKSEQIQRDFRLFYEQNLRQIYEMLEPKRQKYLKLFLKRFFFFLATGLFIWVLCRTDFISPQIYKDKNFQDFCFLLVLIALYILNLPFSAYIEETKMSVMEKLLSFWGYFTYSHKNIISQQNIEKSELFTFFDREDTDDAFCGMYKGTEMSVCEHELRIHSKKGDITTFRGVLILLKFNKRFKSKIVALNRGRWLNFFLNNLIISFPLLMISLIPFINLLLKGIVEAHSVTDLAVHIIAFLKTIVLMWLIIYVIFWLCRRIYRYFRPQKANQKIELEGIPFLRKWRVQADNQIEARCILTPVLMEKMLKVKKLFYGRHVDFAFFERNLLIAVHTRKNMFETTSLLTPALRYHKIRTVINQLYSIFAMVDLFDFNEKPVPVPKWKTGIVRTVKWKKRHQR